MLCPGINALRAIKQYPQTSTWSCIFTGKPGDHWHLPTGLFTGRRSHSRSLDHTAAGVRGPAHRWPCERADHAKQFMGLTPVDGQLQFNSWTVGSQDHVHAHRAAPDQATQHDPCHERALLHKLRLPVGINRQLMLLVIPRNVPRIPELTSIAVATKLQWRRELIDTLLILQSSQSSVVQLDSQKTVAETPAPLGDDLHPHRIPHCRLSRRRRCLIRTALQRQCHDSLGLGQLHPEIAARCRLRRKGLAFTRPPSAGQTHQGRPALQGLKTTPCPVLPPLFRPWVIA